ncbi:MAG: hypothetical protein AAFQ20_14415 [Bacteroidota bacterium]
MQRQAYPNLDKGIGEQVGRKKTYAGWGIKNKLLIVQRGDEGYFGGGTSQNSGNANRG